MDCCWENVYNRLKKLGKLEKMKEPVKLRDFSKMIPTAELKKTTYYDIEK